MAKELIKDARRGNLFHIDPKEVHIVGLDDKAGVKPTKAKVEERTQKNADGEQKTRPSGVLVRKLVEAEALELPEGFLQALRWIRGDLSATRIKGLSAAIAKVQKPAAPKAPASAAIPKPAGWDEAEE